MLIREVTDVIERFAPLAWQESYDNAGLIVGRPDDEVHRALLAVDVTDEVMAEAEREGCDMVITHHPIVFHALKVGYFLALLPYEVKRILYNRQVAQTQKVHLKKAQLLYRILCELGGYGVLVAL